MNYLYATRIRTYTPPIDARLRQNKVVGNKPIAQLPPYMWHTNEL
jgi:hypothetical protein